MDTLWQDLKSARDVAQEPGIHSRGRFTLALGIGVNSTVFSSS